MANPIVIDCGGSTRVKKILVGGGFGEMNGLLDVVRLNPPSPPSTFPLPGTSPLPVGATGSQHRAGGPYANLSIVFQDAAGTPFSIAVPLAPLPANFVVTSNAGQSLMGDVVAGGDLILTVFSTVSDPLVDAKQNRADGAASGRRRYVVVNAGAIKTVSAGGVAIFDATNTAIAPIAPGAVGPAGGPAAPVAGAPL